MELEGRVWKEENESGWLAEVPYLHIMTQGTSKKDALAMIADALQLLMEDTYGIKPKISVTYYGKELFGIRCSNNSFLLEKAWLTSKQ